MSQFISLGGTGFLNSQFCRKMMSKLVSFGGTGCLNYSVLEERDDSLVIYVAEKDVKDQRQVARGYSGPSGSHVELALALLGPHVAPWILCKSS